MDTKNTIKDTLHKNIVELRYPEALKRVEDSERELTEAREAIRQLRDQVGHYAGLWHVANHGGYFHQCRREGCKDAHATLKETEKWV